MASAAAPAAAAIPPSKRYARLVSGHESSLKNFAQLLTASVAADNLARAFPSAAERYPAAVAANDDPHTRGVLAFAMEAEFGALARAAPEAIPRLVDDVVRNFQALMREELVAIAVDHALPDKFAELERREDVLRAAAGGAAAGADRPAPLALLPDDEMRSVAVEAKLAHEAALSKELERIRKENAVLDAEVSGLSARSRVVNAKIEARVAALRAAAAAAAGVLDADAPSTAGEAAQVEAEAEAAGDTAKPA